MMVLAIRRALTTGRRMWPGCGEGEGVKERGGNDNGDRGGGGTKWTSGFKVRLLALIDRRRSRRGPSRYRGRTDSRVS